MVPNFFTELFKNNQHMLALYQLAQTNIQIYR